MSIFTRSVMAAALAAGVLGGAAAMQTAQAQHVVSEQEAGRLSFDALTAAPARHYVQPVQYYHRRHWHPRHRFYRHGRRY